MLNTHGYKINGLRKIAGHTKGLCGGYDPYYLELVYNKSTGEAWTNEHVDLGHSWYTRYDDSSIVRIGNLCYPMTMQELADLIADRLTDLECRAEADAYQEAYWMARMQRENAEAAMM